MDVRFEVEYKRYGKWINDTREVRLEDGADGEAIANCLHTFEEDYGELVAYRRDRAMLQEHIELAWDEANYQTFADIEGAILYGTDVVLVPHGSKAHAEAAELWDRLLEYGDCLDDNILWTHKHKLDCDLVQRYLDDPKWIFGEEIAGQMLAITDTEARFDRMLELIEDGE